MPSISLFIVLVMVHVSAPDSKILSTVERKKLIFSLMVVHGTFQLSPTQSKRKSKECREKRSPFSFLVFFVL